MWRSGLFLVLVLSIASAVAGQTAPASPAAPPGATREILPTADELQKMYAEGKYQDVLKSMGKVLALKGEAARPYPRYDMLVLKGDCHLMLKQTAWAVEAFAAAAKEPGDAKTTGVARATELLIKRSSATGYVPKTPAGGAERGKRSEPIPIADRENRKKALTALYADELAAFGPKVKRALASPALGETMAVAGTIADIQAMEVAASGDDTDTRRLADSLSEHATTVLADAVKAMSRHVEDIYRTASEKQETDRLGRFGEIYYTRAGLSGQMISDLKGTAKTSGEVIAAAKQLVAMLKGDAKGYDAIIADAQKLGKRAIEVLNTDYTGVYTR